VAAVIAALALTSCAQSSGSPDALSAGSPGSGDVTGASSATDVEDALPAGDPVVVPGPVLAHQGDLPARLLRLPGAQDLPPEARNARISGPVTLHHANIYTAMSSAAFASDLATVVAGRPDVVTLNETYRRTPAQLRPPGYDEYRAEGPRDARETPVLWRTDRWRRVDAGTFLMHDRRTKWGTRYVNWVTLEEIASGARLSVISGHASPRGGGRAGLLHVFLARLDLLAGQLAQRGPVLVGADLNTFYSRSPFLRTAFPRSGLVTTFDTLGQPAGGWATNDYGKTIDYILTAGVLPQRQSITRLAHSDHHMVAATVEVLPSL
jgi:endonuclease/exonuclease/phosphatase (EEP) superfamily protein YafD